jgi:hypothetical protein
MLADIVSGELDWADVMFLCAAILAAVAAVVAWPQRTVSSTLGWAAVCALAIGWLLL